MCQKKREHGNFGQKSAFNSANISKENGQKSANNSAKISARKNAQKYLPKNSALNSANISSDLLKVPKIVPKEVHKIVIIY